MIRYNARTKQIVDLYNEVNSDRLILSPYFQRNYVWRDIHKTDFIDTIIRGFPFPQIFVAKGTINVETKQSTSCVVDGQQRLTTIIDYIDGKFEYDGRVFDNLPQQQQEDFLKYEVSIIDLDLGENDPALFEIFKRLNRTYYSMTAIEKLSSEYSSGEFMLAAKLLNGQLEIDDPDGAEFEEKSFVYDPNIPRDFLIWASKQDVDDFRKWILESKLFSQYEIQRMNHLMYTLNLMAYRMKGGYNRNEKVKDCLEEYNSIFEYKDQLVSSFNKVAGAINKSKINEVQFWNTKSNAYTLFCVLMDNESIRDGVFSGALVEKLKDFPEKISPEYSNAAREGVNNKKERDLRYKAVREFLLT
ncbi:DUF262 domain-containing protein [Shinella zoogloeoides]|uniref:DUF262 domain-containing protein n=1 Tax=Shinella zoogloeoides TaxID=352475 RepID=UPI00299EE430|nr:DUF262 domain-containing protein [Shinella zoogloeoides]WPE20491.1 hypothetical protein ShzoTeo12_16820 [Shinella zoogloeoides]